MINKMAMKNFVGRGLHTETILDRLLPLGIGQA